MFYTTEGLIDYASVKSCAERIDEMRHARARTACAAAGLDPSIIGIHVHNALVSLHYGKPWPEVDYSFARQAKQHLEQSFNGSRTLQKLYDRKGFAAFAWRRT